MNLKKVFLCGITAAYILTALPCTPAYALTLEQLSTDSSSIDVYFHDDGADLTTLTKENITATLDGTSIPIKSFEQSEERVNYMFLLTDGLHNIGPSKEELVHTLQQWETLSRSKYFFSFYLKIACDFF